jgi:dihydroxyacid dehydratase/phosphogluconate dehydratase
VPCNKIHVFLMDRIKAGIRDAGGFPMEFPVHPIQETGKRPTAALDRNLQYLSLVEVLHGYPIDGVVLTTGLRQDHARDADGRGHGGPAGDRAQWRADAGRLVQGQARGLRHDDLGGAADAGPKGEIGYEEFMELACASSPSLGHCNTMGTASTMNALAEALGMTLPGAAAIPAPFRERMEMAYLTGRRIVGMVEEDLKPSDILTRAAFLNAIKVNTAIGGSTNAPPHLQAIARHIGVELHVTDWQTHGHDLPLLVNLQPAGEYLGESFFRAGGVPAVMGELLAAGQLDGTVMTATGQPMADAIGGAAQRGPRRDPALRRSVADRGGVPGPVRQPLRQRADEDLRDLRGFPRAVPQGRGLRRPRGGLRGTRGLPRADQRPGAGHRGGHIPLHPQRGLRGLSRLGRGGEHAAARRLIRAGVNHLPTVGDGRQSGTSESPSILNASPEAAVGGGLALLKTGDRVRLDLRAARSTRRSMRPNGRRGALHGCRPS